MAMTKLIFSKRKFTTNFDCVLIVVNGGRAHRVCINTITVTRKIKLADACQLIRINNLVEMNLYGSRFCESLATIILFCNPLHIFFSLFAHTLSNIHCVYPPRFLAKLNSHQRQLFRLLPYCRFNTVYVSEARALLIRADIFFPFCLQIL